MLPELQSVQGYQEEGCRSGKQTVGRQKPLTAPKGRAKKSNLLAPLQLERPSQSHPTHHHTPTGGLCCPELWDPPWWHKVRDSRTEPTQPAVQTPNPIVPLQTESLPGDCNCTHTSPSFQPGTPPADPYPVSPQFLISSSQDGAMVLLLSLPFAITP